MKCFVGTMNTIRVERGRKKSGRKGEETTEREREIRSYKEGKKRNKIGNHLRRGRDERTNERKTEMKIR